MTTRVLLRAVKNKKSTIIKEKGKPRFVVLDWDTYRTWEEMREDFEDSERLREALSDPKNQRKTSFADIQGGFCLF